MGVQDMHAEHLKDLRNSGLTDATIDKLGIYTETRPAEIERLLNRGPGFAAKNQLGPCLVFPYPSTKHVRLKPLWARRIGKVEITRDFHGEEEQGEDNRNTIKYESPLDSGQYV